MGAFFRFRSPGGAHGFKVQDSQAWSGAEFVHSGCTPGCCHSVHRSPGVGDTQAPIMAYLGPKGAYWFLCGWRGMVKRGSGQAYDVEVQ